MIWNILATVLFVPFTIGGLARLCKAHEREPDVATTVSAMVIALAMTALIIWRIWA